MKTRFFNSLSIIAFVFTIVLTTSCSTSGNRNKNNMKTEFLKGTYGYDSAFFAAKNISTVELRDSSGKASVLIVPEYQGRVMTSSVNGGAGVSFGWINYKHIESGVLSSQFNPFGGEERIWFGPEGGPFSIYFKKGAEQIFSNWVVPKEIDTEPFDLVSKSLSEVSFRKEFKLINASGTELSAAVDRSVRLLNKKLVEKSLGMEIDNSLSFVAYESENTLENKGTAEWTKKTGTLSVWMLAMFNPSAEGVVFIPYKQGLKDSLGPEVNDDYFGKVPAERLVVNDGILFFRVDGKHRSKIGISPLRALPFCGSYDPFNKVLTLLWYSSPESSSEYVNSKWGSQDLPFSGDVVNSYNDGPVEDGSIMGPFYEIESSSPAAFLKPGEKLSHIQRIFHISGDETRLSNITEKLFSVSIEEIVTAFSK
jgi:hypothetical protein